MGVRAGHAFCTPRASKGLGKASRNTGSDVGAVTKPETVQDKRRKDRGWRGPVGWSRRADGDSVCVPITQEVVTVLREAWTGTRSLRSQLRYRLGPGLGLARAASLSVARRRVIEPNPDSLGCLCSHGSAEGLGRRCLQSPT